MVKYLIRRFLLAILTCIVISLLSFIIIQLPPGDYVTSYVLDLTSAGQHITPEQEAALRALYGLDEPVWTQYLLWISRVAVGDFGMSMEWRKPISELIGERLLLTAVLAIATLLLTWILALPIGIYSAVRKYSIGDYAATVIGFIGLAVPSFLSALVISYIGFAYFGLNVGGLFSPEYANAPWSWTRLWDMLCHLPLPAGILALASCGPIIRIMRANLLDELQKPYLVTALSKGMSPWRAIMKYPVRIALNPFISTIGHTLPYVVSGTIIVSLVLGLPTVGPVLYRALISQDMFVAGTVVLLLGVLTVIGTLLSDLLLAITDPRIRMT
ncbi:ABC transporter permease [Mesorhizobium sp. M0816]|uniref:ABC transporter permease n=1 Tax=Mesorhizobium sp. M0816 TaxID=2957006 RepID=UPI00333A62B9